MNREELLSEIIGILKDRDNWDFRVEYSIAGLSLGHSNYGIKINTVAQKILDEVFNQPWLDKPDSEDWWWFSDDNRTSNIYFFEANDLSKYRWGKWQKAFVPNPPKES